MGVYLEQGTGDLVVPAGSKIRVDGGTVEGLAAVTEQAALPDLTENTGAIGGTNDGNLPSLTPTATNPAAPTAYSAHASGAVPVVSNAANDLDTTAAALATLRGEVATYETAISALVVDVAALTAAVREVAADNNALKALLRLGNVIADA